MPYFPFKFETYQDVKNNLVFWTVVGLYLAGSFVYFWIVPPAHRRVLPGRIWLQHVELFTGLGVIAIVLVWGFNIHDQIYDRYIVKWRERYDAKIILPGLCAPFESKLDSRFYSTATANREQFMRDLFYEYVHDRDPKIKQNTLVRFYERITNYWVTQAYEVFLCVVLIVAVVYLPLYRRMNLPWRSPISGILLTVGLLALNAYLADRARLSVQKSTEEEIQEIHQNHRGDLEQRVSTISKRFGLSYGSTDHSS
jgi:hypothetical protein